MKRELAYWPSPTVSIGIWWVLLGIWWALGLTVFFVMLRLGWGWLLAQLEIRHLRNEIACLEHEITYLSTEVPS